MRASSAITSQLPVERADSRWQSGEVCLQLHVEHFNHRGALGKRGCLCLCLYLTSSVHASWKKQLHSAYPSELYVLIKTYCNSQSYQLLVMKQKPVKIVLF